MFTGIVEETGEVRGVRKLARSIRLSVQSRICARGIRVGDSVAVNGVCLTVVKAEPKRPGKLLHFDLLEETWRVTNLRDAAMGARVNLERALTPQSRLGGHFVTGHVDGVGTIKRLVREGADYVLDIEVPRDLRRFLVRKGSVAVDGISLTVADMRRGMLRLWIIPHTWKVTALSDRREGDSVNLETDLLGKYVERLVRA